MSIADNLPVRLWWDGRRGGVSCDGVHVELRERPAGLGWHVVDYAPGYVATCSDRHGDQVRDLEAGEIRAIVAYLAAVAAGARARL